MSLPAFSPDDSIRRRGRMTIAFFFLLSALYFADTLLRASLKNFWFDELVTVYLCRLPSFSATWSAVLQGGDFNPPLFYLLTRASQHLFGEGLIATRLPAILGFWVFGLCLYCFVARRLGSMCGVIAALAPIFTLAHLYAYEARAHGAVLAWCGLMLICWQRGRVTAQGITWRSNLWVGGLSVAFLAALLTHVYAIYLIVPMLLVEGYAAWRRRPVHAGVVLALLVPPLLVAPLFLHMTRVFRLESNVPMPRPDRVLHDFFLLTYGPAVVLLLGAIAFIAWSGGEKGTTTEAEPSASFNQEELVLAVGLVLLPILGMLGAKISHGPFFARYFIDSIAGYSLLLAQAIAWSRSIRVANKLALLFLFLLIGDVLLATYCRVRHGDLRQADPSSGLAFSPIPSQPLLRNASLLADHSDRDVLITGEAEYPFLYYYAPPPLRARLYFGAPEDNGLFLTTYRRLARIAHLDLRRVTYREFFAAHKDFLVYSAENGQLNGSCLDCTEKFLAAGYTLRSVEHDNENLLEAFSR